MSNSLIEKKFTMAAVRSAELLVKHGLGNWKIKTNRKRTVLAQTQHNQKTITFSKYFLMVADKEQLEGVTLHEATHALLGVGHGHDKAFVDLCTKISPNDKYATRAVRLPIDKYNAKCSECGQTGSCNSNKKMLCGICSKEGKLIELEVEENKPTVNLW